MGSSERQRAPTDQPEIPLPDLEFWPQLEFDPELMTGIDWLDNTGAGLHAGGHPPNVAHHPTGQPSTHAMGMEQSAFNPNISGHLPQGAPATQAANTMAPQPQQHRDAAAPMLQGDPVSSPLSSLM